MNDHSPRRDAQFSDVAERPLRLRAIDVDDLWVVSALVQDSVVQVGEVSWLKGKRRFAALVNRFRWEAGGQGPERVRSMLVVENVSGVRAQGVDPQDRDTVLSILSLAWEGEADGPGRLIVTLAGDGQLAVEAEALELVLQDVTQPYRAPSGKAPSHPE